MEHIFEPRRSFMSSYFLDARFSMTSLSCMSMSPHNASIRPRGIKGRASQRSFNVDRTSRT
jgi:hypothetical protein